MKKTKGFGLNSLQTKLAILVVGASTLVLLLFSALDYISVRHAKYNELEHYTQLLTERTARILLRPVWNVDIRAVESIILSELDDKRIHAIFVLEDDGRTVFFGLRQDGTRLTSIPSTDTKDMLIHSQELRMNEQYVGSVLVLVTSEYVRNELFEQVIATSLRSIALVAALCAIILFTVRRVVIRPVQRLSDTTRMITEDKLYAVRAEKPHDDEIGSLIDSFNEMLERIEARDQMLTNRRKHLEALVSERTIELDDARKRAEEASKAKSEFVANMSHELRTPMNAIIGMVDITERTQLSVKQQEYLKIIKTSSKSLLHIVNDILDFSKIEANRLELEIIPFDLRKLLDEVTDLFGDRVADKGVELVADMDANVPASLLGDPLRLKQVLINLVTNAFKFTEQGEVYMAISLLAQDGDTARLAFSVRDTGIGIKADRLEHLFDMFTQADGSTTRKYGGTGLGLAIAKELVNLMGGDIVVQSEVGKGSTFSFSIQMQLAAQQEESQYLLPAPVRGKRVLLVEDNISNRTVIEKMLTSMGMLCDSLDDGAAAFAALKDGAEEYGLLLLDWRLPGMDGLQIVERLQQQKITLPPVMLMTAFGREAEVSRAEALGIGAFLLKPVKIASLHRVILETFGIQQPQQPETIQRESMKEFQGIRALLVEDNIINQQVAKEVLESEGVVVTIADTGTVAIDLLKDNTYDVVLMDLQMPDMDGFEVTRIIRRSPQYDTLPILAMTAHVLSEDKAMAMDVGMNDYLTKPIDRLLLFSVLRKWTLQRTVEVPAVKRETPAPAPAHEPVPEPTRPAEAPAAPPVAPPAASDEARAEATLRQAVTATIDSDACSVEGLPETLPGLDIAEGVQRLSGKEWLYVKILEGFLGAYANAMPKLYELHAAEDSEGLSRMAHTIAGAAGNVSANSLRQKALAVEQAVDRDKDGIPDLLKDMDAAMLEACESMRDALQRCSE